MAFQFTSSPDFVWRRAAFLGLAAALLVVRADTLYISNYGGASITAFQSGAASTFVDGLNLPRGIVFDARGNMFVANAGDNTILKIAIDGTVSIFATNLLNKPMGIAFDSHGNLFVANNGGYSIAKFSPDGSGEIFATTGANTPSGLAIDSADNVFVAEYFAKQIEKITPAGVKTRFAPTGSYGPHGIAFNKAGVLHVVLPFADAVYRVSALGNLTLVRGGLRHPEGLTFDEEDNLYVANVADNTITKITPTGVLTTISDVTINDPWFLAARPKVAPFVYLEATALANAVRVMWPTNAASFALQSTVELGPSANWSDVTEPFTTIKAAHVLTTNPSDPARFFRLYRTP